MRRWWKVLICLSCGNGLAPLRPSTDATLSQNTNALKHVKPNDKNGDIFGYTGYRLLWGF